MTKKKILVIDDEEKFCQIIKRRLELTGEYVVSIAYTGKEGIEKASKAQYDLVITDMRMPGMDGDAVIEVLKGKYPDLPVLLCSVHYDDKKTINPMIAGKADALIGKPIDHETLHKAINEALGNKGVGRK